MLHVRGMKCGQLKYLYEHWAWLVTIHSLWPGEGLNKMRWPHESETFRVIGIILTKKNREIEGLDNMYIVHTKYAKHVFWSIFPMEHRPWLGNWWRGSISVIKWDIPSSNIVVEQCEISENFKRDIDGTLSNIQQRWGYYIITGLQWKHEPGCFECQNTC